MDIPDERTNQVLLRLFLRNDFKAAQTIDLGNSRNIEELASGTTCEIDVALDETSPKLHLQLLEGGLSIRPAGVRVQFP